MFSLIRARGARDAASLRALLSYESAYVLYLSKTE